MMDENVSQPRWTWLVDCPESSHRHRVLGLLLLGCSLGPADPGLDDVGTEKVRARVIGLSFN